MHGRRKKEREVRLVQTLWYSESPVNIVSMMRYAHLTSTHTHSTTSGDYVGVAMVAMVADK